jgi:2-polyprenyl-3-methyl-5-hydroxy-6-metoxy-1,4-benzoquinol methylase
VIVRAVRNHADRLVRGFAAPPTLSLAEMGDSVSNSIDDRDAVVERYFSEPWRYLAKSPLSAARMEILRSMLGDCSGCDIVELGCGDGRMSLQFLPAAHSVTLIDRSAGMLDLARANTPRGCRHKVEYLAGDVHDIELQRTFDVVLCIGVLAHVRTVCDVLDTAIGAVRPGGRCVFQISDADRRLERALRRYVRIRARIDRQPPHSTNEMTADGVCAAVSRRGPVLRAIRYYSLLVPGTGPLPSGIVDALVRASWTRPRLSRHATEAMMLFSA